MTLLGDAAHLALANGEGANLAMLDGAELAKVLAARPDDVETAIAEYEQAMFVRCETPMEEDFLLESIFGDDIPERLLNLFGIEERKA